jgi:hypothetical protein
LLARQVAQEVSTALLEKVQDLSERLDASEAREVMRASEAAELLSMGEAAFRKLAPEVPRCRISDNRYVYLRKDLPSWLEAKRGAPTWWWREVNSDPSTATRNQPTKKGPRQRVQRLV